MSEILRHKIERAKREIKSHVRKCSAPIYRNKGFSNAFNPMHAALYQPNPFRLNGTAEIIISSFSEHYEACAHDRSCDSLAFIYSYIDTISKRFSEAVDPLLRINITNDNHTRNLSEKIKKSVDKIKDTCEGYAEINQRYQEGNGVGTGQLAELESRFLYSQSAMLDLRSHATVASGSFLSTAERRSERRRTEQQRESLIARVMKLFEQQHNIVDNLRCEETSADCRVQTLGSIQSCFRLVDDAAALYYRLTEKQKETVVNPRDEFELTLDDLRAMMQKTKSVLSRISPAIAAQMNITPTGTARAHLDILLAGLSSTLASTRLGLNRCCPTFVSSPIQSPYNNHDAIDGCLFQFRDSWMRLFICLGTNDGVDASVESRITQQEQRSRQLTDQLKAYVNTYSKSMGETRDLIEKIQGNLDRLKSKIEELYNQGSCRPASHYGQTDLSAERNPPQVLERSVFAIQPGPAPPVIQTTPPSSPAVAAPVRPTTGSSPPCTGKVRKRRKSRAETGAQKPRGEGSLGTGPVIKAQPRLPFPKTKVYWGFFDQNSDYGPEPNDLFRTVVKNYAPGAKRTTFDDKVRRAIENPTNIISDRCFTDRLKNRRLRHFTIPHTNISVFYTYDPSGIHVYVVARHVGRDNKNYRGEGSVPECPGRTFKTSVQLK
ncbi:MAG: hypothetical protein AAF550_05110 [Myxococcota bacterium]